jgi:CubicO group peptidase (beta-lactamase class C family)
MKKIFSKIVCAMLCVSIFATSGNLCVVYGATENKNLPSGISYGKLGETIESYVEEHQDTTAGMAVDVFDTEQDIYRNYFGYADVENKISAGEDTVFEWGSVTKLLVWVSVMQLYEQGKLELDKDITAYLPEGFLTNLSYDTPITMIHLMNHTAGFQDVVSDVFIKDADAILPLGEELQAHEPAQIHEPGTVTAYSNWGVALAGYIVERVSGMEFAAYVHQNIFAPLGMEHSALAADLSDNEWVMEQRKNLECYTAKGNLIPDCFYYITLYPAGMCTSTLADFSLFAKELLGGGTTLFENPDTWQEMFTPTDYYGDSDVPENCHGFWVAPLGDLAVGHGGNTVGGSSYLLLDLEAKTGAVVMTNQNEEIVYNVDMMDLIFGEFQEENYFPGRVKPVGVYRSAQKIRKGPFKFTSLLYLATLGAGKDEVWTNGSNDKICYQTIDYLKVPTATLLLEIGLAFLWIAALVFSVISLLVLLIRKIACKLRRKERAPGASGKWSIGASLLQLLFAVLLCVVVSEASAYAVSSSYTWIFAVIGVEMLVMIVMAVYGVWHMRKIPVTGKRRIYHIAVEIGMVVTVFNIAYWNLFMFWAV